MAIKKDTLDGLSAGHDQPSGQRHLANAKTDHTVCDIGRKLVSTAPVDRRWTDGARHVQLQCGFAGIGSWSPLSDVCRRADDQAFVGGQVDLFGV
jgi:hypothetical protein